MALSTVAVTMGAPAPRTRIAAAVCSVSTAFAVVVAALAGPSDWEASARRQMSAARTAARWPAMTTALPPMARSIAAATAVAVARPVPIAAAALIVFKAFVVRSAAIKAAVIAVLVK